MSFRKRNVIASRTPADSDPNSSTSAGNAPLSIPGLRPSSIDGRLVTSTGTSSLDDLLAGHGGLPTGHALLIEENGTTDYAGALTKYFAAEGVVQGHYVHVFGMPEAWGRELPGLVAGEADKSDKDASKEKMKIAWRYEGLGEFGSGRRGASRPSFPSMLYIYPIDTANQVPCHKPAIRARFEWT